MTSWNLADLFESVVDVVPEREAFVSPSARLSYRALDSRANRLAHALAGRGVGAGDRVALALRNCAEYLEATLAAFKLRAIPINVNVRYTTSELSYLLADAGASFVIHEPEIHDRMVGAAPHIVADGRALARGEHYEHALAAQSADRPDVIRSGEDRYILYTGGTTGMPRGVVWRHEDLFYAALGGTSVDGDSIDTRAELLERARRSRMRCLTASPFTHGTAHWAAMSSLLQGAAVIADDRPTFVAEDLWATVAAEAVTVLVIVGDAFGRPLADALERSAHRWDLGELLVVVSGGAVLTPAVRRDLLRHLPATVLVDGYGTSETGGQGLMVVWPGQSDAAATCFDVAADTAVLDEAGHPVVAGSGTVGRLARRGRLPLGYHGDPVRSADTFPVIDGVRWAIPGDFGRSEADGTVTLLGRGATSINSGGEKVFPEEVEAVLKSHDDVLDAVVVGVPEPRWGQEVTAVVALRVGHAVEAEALIAHCRTHLARYKAPRRIVVVDAVRRTSSGKADLPWAQGVAGRRG